MTNKTSIVASAESIARELSASQAAAFFGIFKWTSLDDQEKGERQLYELGLWSSWAWDRAHLTPLGREVYAILESYRND